MMTIMMYLSSLMLCAAIGKIPDSAGLEVANSPTMAAKSSMGSREEPMDESEQVAPIQNWEEMSIAATVGYHLSRDPLALTSSVLLVAYLIAQLLIRPSAQKVKPTGKHDYAKDIKPHRVKNSGKSAFAVSVNQRLITMQSWEEVLDFAVANTGRTDVVNVVTAIHRSSKLAMNKNSGRKLVKDARFPQLLGQLQGFLSEEIGVSVRTRAVGNTSWALAKLNYREEDGQSLLRQLVASFIEHSAAFKPEELMNTVWAFAELSRDAKENEELALKVARVAVLCDSKFPEFTLQQSVYFAWALARLSTVGLVRADAEVVTGLLAFKTLIVGRVTPEIEQLTTKNLAMVSWAIAHLHKVRPDSTVGVSELLQAVGDSACKRGISCFFPGELASIAWALSKCQVVHAGFYKEFRNHLVGNGARGFGSQDLANVLCAFVNADSGDDELFNVLATACGKNRSLNKLEKTMVNWAFSQLPHIAAPKLQ